MEPTFTGNFLKYSLFVSAVIVALVMCEFCLRGILFLNFPLGKSLRNPSFYANSHYSDDWWVLRKKFGQHLSSGPKQPHPLLGWTGRFDRTTLRHDDSAKIGEKQVVLLYGDSFAACAERPCYEDILNSDPTFSQRCILLNYGVGGYGQDQAYLLMTETAPQYSGKEKPVIILSILNQDIDRNLLMYREARKPRFELSETGLALKKVPIAEGGNNEAYLPTLTMHSYLYRFFVYGMPLSKPLARLLQGYEEIKQQRIRLARALMKESGAFMRANSRRHFGLLFSSDWNGGSNSEEDVDWRTELLERLFTEEGIPYVSFERDILATELATSHLSHADYFIPNDGHPNSRTNRLIAGHLWQQLADVCGPVSSEFRRR